MIQIEIDWSDYTDHKIEQYKWRSRCEDCSLTDKDIEEARIFFQPPTYSVHYGINPNSVASYQMCKEREYCSMSDKCDYGIPKGTCAANITFINGKCMKLYCNNDAADKILKMLQGEKSDEVVKVNGVKEYEGEIYTKTEVTSMPKD